MFITPGPNNAMLTMSGLKFGFKRSLPHVIGIALGHAVQVSAVCLGLGFFLLEYPEFQLILKWLCFGYLLFLAYKMIGSFKDYKKESGRPLRAYEAALFQWINPKAWTISSMAASSFLSTSESLILPIFYIGIVALIICPISISPWAAFGSGIKSIVNNNKVKVIIEFFLAFLLLITAILIVIGK